MTRRRHLILGGLLLSFLYLGSFLRVCTLRNHLRALRKAHPPGTSLALKGVVVSIPVRGRETFTVRLEAPFTVEVKGRGEPPRPGDLVRVVGKVSPLETFKNPWGMDRKAWYTREGIAFPLFARKWELLKARKLPFYRQWPLDFASWGIATFSRDLGRDEGPVAASLVLGFRRGLDWETRHLFTSTGLGHLLAVSGFHMGVVFLFIYTIIKLILRTYTLFHPVPSMDQLPSRRALVPSLLILFFYLLVTGAPPSARRAFIMIACWVLARLWNRDRSLEGALLLAFGIMTLLDPLAIQRVGFQLTFAAMVGVVVVLRLVEKLEGWKAILGGYLAMALVIPLFTLPLILFHFHRFTPYSPLANLLFVLPAGILVMLGLVHLLLAALSLQGWIILLEKTALEVFTRGLGAVSHLPGGNLWVTRKEALFLSALVVTGLLGTLLAKKGKRWAQTLPLAALVFLLLPSPRGALVLDMGKRGRALLFQGGETILVDAGVARGRGAWSSLRNALLWRNVHRLDALVVSRVIPSRASLVPRVLETFKTRTLYLPPAKGKPALTEGIVQVARRKGTRLMKLEKELHLDGLQVRRGRRGLEVSIPSLGLETRKGGWYWRGKPLEPWRTGAIEIPISRKLHPTGPK